MSLLKKGTGKQTDFRETIDQLMDKNIFFGIAIILGLCAGHIVAFSIVAWVADFLVKLLGFDFNGLVVASLNLVLTLVRNLGVTLVMYNYLLKKNVLKFDENIRYVLFLVINFVVYAVTGTFVVGSTGGYALSFLIGSLFDYVGLGAVIRLLTLLSEFGYLLRYNGFIFFLLYTFYQAIGIVSIAVAAGWIVKLVNDEAAEQGKTLLQVLAAPFKAQRDAEMTASILSEMSFEQASTPSVEDLLPVSEELVNMYCTVHQKYFGADKMVLVRNKLLLMSESQYQMATSLEYVNPDMMLFVSATAGGFGMDRFLLGETAVGLVKLLTMGCFGVLTLIDLFTIRKKTQEMNFKKIMSI